VVGGHEHKSRRIHGSMETRVNQIGTSKLVLDHPGIASQAKKISRRISSTHTARQVMLRPPDGAGALPLACPLARSNFLSPNRKLWCW